MKLPNDVSIREIDSIWVKDDGLTATLWIRLSDDSIMSASVEAAELVCRGHLVQPADPVSHADHTLH